MTDLLTIYIFLAAVAWLITFPKEDNLALGSVGVRCPIELMKIYRKLEALRRFRNRVGWSILAAGIGLAGLLYAGRVLP